MKRINKLTVFLATMFTLCVTPLIAPQASLAACNTGQAMEITKTVTYQGSKPVFHFKLTTQGSDKQTHTIQDKNKTIKWVVSDKSKKKLQEQALNQKTNSQKPAPAAKPIAKPAPQKDAQTVAQPAPENVQQPTAQTGSFQQQVVDLVNQERAKHGLSPLQMKQDLNSVAQMKAQDMTDKKYFSHTSPTYGSPFDMMKKHGISYLAAGENIAMGQKTPAQVVQDWMNSPGHRANILNSNFTEIGVGVSNSYNGNGYIWVQAFCKR